MSKIFKVLFQRFVHRLIIFGVKSVQKRCRNVYGHIFEFANVTAVPGCACPQVCHVDFDVFRFTLSVLCKFQDQQRSNMRLVIP